VATTRGLSRRNASQMRAYSASNVILAYASPVRTSRGSTYSWALPVVPPGGEFELPQRRVYAHQFSPSSASTARTSSSPRWKPSSARRERTGRAAGINPARRASTTIPAVPVIKIPRRCASRRASRSSSSTRHPAPRAMAARRVLASPVSSRGNVGSRHSFRRTRIQPCFSAADSRKRNERARVREDYLARHALTFLRSSRSVFALPRITGMPARPISAMNASSGMPATRAARPIDRLSLL